MIILFRFIINLLIRRRIYDYKKCETKQTQLHIYYKEINNVIYVMQHQHKN